METKKPGRPKKVKLVSIDKAIELVRDYYIRKGLHESDLPKIIPAKQTIYNKISKKLIHNYGKGKGYLALLDEDEVIEKLCS